MAGAAARLQVAQAEVSGRLHAAFRDLVRERCLERCKPCDLPRVMPRVGRRLCYKIAALLLKISKTPDGQRRQHRIHATSHDAVSTSARLCFMKAGFHNPLMPQPTCTAAAGLPHPAAPPGLSFCGGKGNGHCNVASLQVSRKQAPNFLLTQSQLVAGRSKKLSACRLQPHPASI